MKFCITLGAVLFKLGMVTVMDSIDDVFAFCANWHLGSGGFF